VALIEVYEEIDVHSLLWVSDLIINMHLYQKENPDTLAIVIVDQALLCVHVVDEPLQEFYARKNWIFASHHV
jgi:hypothetical protein